MIDRISPFEKGGRGDLMQSIPQTNPPRSPFFKGGSGPLIFVALRTTVVTLVLTGMVYPLVITGISQALFSHRANGSLVTDDSGQVVGSALIGQRFSNPAYVWSRPSAAGTNG